MNFYFALAAFSMGVVGGPHCIAMCGAACGYIQKSQTHPSQFYLFLLGRLLGYSLLGAVAALSVKSLAWITEQSMSLHPLWTFFHALVFAWGLILFITAKQPVWVDTIGRNVWHFIRQYSGPNKSFLMMGFFWVLMPCGLLYSALLMASLQANALRGAISMALFAFGSSLSLWLAPTLLRQLKMRLGDYSEALGMRFTGFILLGISSVAIWMDVFHHTKIWCV